MARFDLESFRNYFVALLQAEMPAKITAMNTEKNDGIVLEGFTADQYFNDMNAKIVNYSKYIFYGFTEVKTISDPRSSDYALDVTLAFDICFADPSGGNISENMIIRYARIMTEIVLEHARDNPSIQDVQVKMFLPTTLISNQTSARMKIAGISIKGTIA